MSHVDEGRLHAWLDGAYGDPALAQERAEIEAHLAACATCRAALEEERLVRERASAVLRAASPAVGSAPPAWSDVLARRERDTAPAPRRRRGVPIAWAASLVLAVGAGWMAAIQLGRDDASVAESQALSVDQAARVGDEVPAAPRPSPDPAPGAGEGGRAGAAPPPAAPDRSSFRDLRVESRARGLEAPVEARREAAKAFEADELAVVSVPGAELLRDYDRAVLDAAWQPSNLDAARAALGREPATLADAEVESIEVASGEQGTAVRVVQRLDPFTLLEIVQRRDPSDDDAQERARQAPMAQAAAEEAEPDSLFVLSPDPDRGAAVVSLRRGDVTLLLRAQVPVDSLRALAARVREPD